MRFLITSSRMPFALDEIRKLGKEGHTVVASDTFKTAPGSHSRFVADWRVTASPLFERRAFIDDVLRIVADYAIDLIVPAFEEAFYLAWHLDELQAETQVFVSPFETLMKLHDKAALISLAESLGVRVPQTTMVYDRPGLAKAIHALPAYFARPAFSRGGVQLLTNTGPLAQALSFEDCRPSTNNPWLVQEYVDGLDVCTFSVAHHGRIAAHSTYIHPREIEHAGGIAFESIVDDDGLAVAKSLVEATGYHGQISFDFRRTEEGLVLIECNPRPTAGVFVMSPGTFVQALVDPRPDRLMVAPAGVRHMYSTALIRDMLLHWREIPDDLEHLLSSARDVYAEPGDLIPALYQFLSYTHVGEYRRHAQAERHKRTDLMAAYFFDISYDGERLDLDEGRQRAAPAVGS